jgi:hypothetical protein
MTNPFQQNPGNPYQGNYSASIPSGVLSTTPNITTGNTNTSTTVNSIAAAVTASKGSLVEIGSGGHPPDILAAAAAAATSITILTATSSTVSGTRVGVYNFPALISGEASAVTNTDTLESSYYVGSSGTGGVVCQTDFNNAVYCDLVFIAGGSFTPTAGGNLQLWFLESGDGGYSFDKLVSNTALARAPDAIIPLIASAHAAGDWTRANGIWMPSCPFKTVVQNEAGVTLPSTWGIWALPEGQQLST